jgi:hypothetical protein
LNILAMQAEYAEYVGWCRMSLCWFASFLTFLRLFSKAHLQC